MYNTKKYISQQLFVQWQLNLQIHLYIKVYTMSIMSPNRLGGPLPWLPLQSLSAPTVGGAPSASSVWLTEIRDLTAVPYKTYRMPVTEIQCGVWG